MKSVGIIGGLGPETTAEFYLSVIFGCQKRDKAQRPSIIISSVPLPLEIERDFILKNLGQERYIPYLINEAERLQKAGADFIVMPCNSLHVFIDQIRESVSVPVLSIVEETVNYLKTNRLKSVGLISTSATAANKIYEGKLIENDITFTTPNDLQKAKMDIAIQRLVEGQHRNADRETIQEIVQELAHKNVDCVALACTDLQLLLPKSTDILIFDTMRVLADATISKILS